MEDFGRVLGVVLEYSLQWQRRALRDSVDPQGGDFRGSAIFEKLSGFIEQRPILEFQHFLRRGAAPNAHLIPAVAATQQFSGSLDADQFAAISLSF